MKDMEAEKYKILIVDDVPKNIQIVANNLQGEGYQMAFAQNGTTALEMAENKNFDLILLDIMMPDMDGFAVCERLKRSPRTREVPVIFLTAKADSESIVHGFEAGAMDYVTKPFNGTELLARVRTHLELYRSRQALKRINQALEKEVAERKQAEKRYRSLYENAVQGIFQSTLSGELLNLNPAYAKILGYDNPEEVLALKTLKDHYDPPEDYPEMVRALRAKERLTNYELRLKRKDGQPIWLLVNVRLTADEDDHPIMEGIVVDNTARKQAEIELRNSEAKFRDLAIHDGLTGLYNTRYLYPDLAYLVQKSDAHHQPFSLIFMDMDNFKRVVDTYGHLNGSQALCEVAQTIRERLQEPEYGVAYGGDEFVVVLPDAGKAQAVEKAEAIREAIRRTSYLTDKGFKVRLSASMGVSTYPDDADDITSLLASADRAMFDVKASGKGGVKQASF